ncbi:MAG: UDP-4-amino-4,6-dideoxy-N-acetyl-beta-L-altrosamine transaminase [Thaumarchaeota archaeon]|jgi:dTDP-4-amino-4,6-dideoxygalactose transaminase|nr:MAG: UDP-4-amino-4,6-dideoxy-N-acetyl-beta-L-altrosamine transaminase [Nitrososphaerota archaeon]
MKVPYFIPCITDQDKRTIMTALRSRWLTNGPMLEKFENNIRKFVGTKHAIGVGSATQSLHLSLRALDIGPGDEVIVPTFTFAATANAVIYCGAKPILTDVDSKTFNIDPISIKNKITKRTKAIIPVHYGGQSCDMDVITTISRKYGLSIVEDCAHALGSKFKNKHCGNIGNLGCFSFYPTKIITSGEGGMVTTNHPRLSKKIQLLRSQGMNILPHQRELKNKWRYDIIDLGYNYRLDEIRAGLGFSQSNRINYINKMRIKIAKKYNKLIKNINGISIPATKENRNHIYHLYTIKIEKDFHQGRNDLLKKLNIKQIGTSIQYYPLHLMSYYKKYFPQKISDFPISNRLKDQVLCLPIYVGMTDKQIEYVVNVLKSN